MTAHCNLSAPLATDPGRSKIRAPVRAPPVNGKYNPGRSGPPQKIPGPVGPGIAKNFAVRSVRSGLTASFFVFKVDLVKTPVG